MTSIFRSTPKIVDTNQPEDFFFHELRKYSLTERKRESSRILQKYADRIPVVVDRGDAKTPSIDRHKFLVPTQCTAAEFQTIVRKRVKLNSDEALFFFVGYKGAALMTGTVPLGQLYKEHQDEDGYLYIIYMKESTFG
jgi:GABA(A) receptor-associated protein